MEEHRLHLIPARYLAAKNLVFSFVYDLLDPRHHAPQTLTNHFDRVGSVKPAARRHLRIVGCPLKDKAFGVLAILNIVQTFLHRFAAQESSPVPPRKRASTVARPQESSKERRELYILVNLNGYKSVWIMRNH